MTVQTQQTNSLAETQKKSFADQKKALVKQQQDVFKMLVTASQPNPLDGEGGMKPSEMVTTTLAIQNAFQALEKRQEEYAQFEEQRLAFESLKLSASLNLVGQTKQIEGNQFSFKDKPVHFDYEIPKEGFKDAELLILGPDYSTIAQFNPELKPGMHHFIWDGKDKDAQKVPNGQYSILLIGANKPGEKTPGKTYIYAPILSVETEEGKTVLMVDDPGTGPKKMPYKNGERFTIGSHIMNAAA